MRQIRTNCRKVFKGQCPTIQTQVFQMFNGMQVNRQRKLSPIEGAYNYSSLTADQRFKHFETMKQDFEQQQVQQQELQQVQQQELQQVQQQEPQAN